MDSLIWLYLVSLILIVVLHNWIVRGLKGDVEYFKGKAEDAIRLAEENKVDHNSLLKKVASRKDTVKYCTVEAFQPNDVEFLSVISQIRAMPEFWFMLYNMRERYIQKIANENSREAQLRAIAWMEIFALIENEINAFQAQYDALTTERLEQDNDSEKMGLS